MLGDTVGYYKNDSADSAQATRALLSYADNPKVWTLQYGVMRYATVNWSRFIRQGGILGNKRIKISGLSKEWPKQFNKLASGTLIELIFRDGAFLSKTKDIVPTRLARYSGLNAGRKIYVNGEPLSVWKPANFETHVNKRIKLKNGGSTSYCRNRQNPGGDAQMHINYTQFINKGSVGR